MPTTVPVPAHALHPRHPLAPLLGVPARRRRRSAISSRVGRAARRQVAANLGVGGGGEQTVHVRQVERLQHDVLAVQRHRVVPGRRCAAAGRPGSGARTPASGSGGRAVSRSGTTPAQCGRSRSASSSRTPPARARTDTSRSGSASTAVSASSRRLGGRLSVGPAGADLLHQRGQHGRSFSALVGDQAGGAVRDDRAVVGAVVELGAGVDQAVEQGDRDADRQPVVAAGGEQRPAAGRAVQVERVADADVQGGQRRAARRRRRSRGAQWYASSSIGVGGGPLVAHPVAGAGGGGPGGRRVHVGHARRPLF